MFATLPELYLSEPTAREDVLPALRHMLHEYPALTQSGTETLARALHVLCYLPYAPETFEVEIAREALLIDGAVAA